MSIKAPPPPRCVGSFSPGLRPRIVEHAPESVLDEVIKRAIHLGSVLPGFVNQRIGKVHGDLHGDRDAESDTTSARHRTRRAHSLRSATKASGTSNAAK